MVSSPRLSSLSLLALALAAVPFASPALADDGPAVPMAETEEDDAAPRDVASVKIELKQPTGKILEYDGALIDWGAEGNVTFKQDDHVHDVSLRIERPSGTASAISMTVGYTKDGNAIIAPLTVDSEIKKREVIRIEGGVAIAITVTPKANKSESSPPPAEEAPPAEEPDAPKEPPKKKDKIIGGGENPLDGLE